MDAVQKWNNELLAKETVALLNTYAFDAIYAETVDKAKEIIRGLIPEGAKIAVGGSVTLNETGVMEEIIRDPKYNFIDLSLIHISTGGVRENRFRTGQTRIRTFVRTAL